MKFDYRKFIPRPSDVIATMAFLALANYATTLFGDPGLGWHLVAGEWMLANREVIRSDPFTFAHTLKFGAPAVWIHDQWLSDIVFTLLVRAGGLNFLQIFVAAVATLPIAFFIGPDIEKNTRDALGAFFILLFSLLSISLQWFARPVVFSFMLFSVLVSLCARPRMSKGELCLFPFIFFLWANLHPAFGLGLTVLFFRVLFEWLTTRLKSLTERKQNQLVALCASLACSGIVTLITPNGPALHRGIWNLTTNSFFMQLNTEWLPPSARDPFFLPFFVFAVLWLMLLSKRLVGLKGIERTFAYLLPTIFLFVALFQRRYIPFFALSAAPILPLLIGRLTIKGVPRALVRADYGWTKSIDSSIRGSLWTSVVAFSFIAVLATGAIPGRRNNPPGLVSSPLEQAVDTAEHVIREQKNRRIFHTPDLGGYLIWRFWPEVKAFIDDRNQVQPPQLYKDFFQIFKADPGWEQVFDVYGFGVVILPEKAPVLEKLMEKGWLTVGKFGAIVVLRAGERPIKPGQHGI